MTPLLPIFLLLFSASAFSSDASPPVFLSHFYISLDRATYNALRDSPSITALAGIEEKHTVAGSENWSGFYVYGRQTYMEFFVADTPPDGTSKEDCGLGLSVEKAGGVKAIVNRLHPVFGDMVGIDKQVRTISTGDIPWYIAGAVDTKRPKQMYTWIMEVDPFYLSAMHPGSLVKHPLSRQQYLSWNFLPDRLLDAVVGIRAALNLVERTQLANELELVGWSVDRQGSGFLARGPDATLEVFPAGSQAGIQQVALRLRRSVPKQAFELGSAKLLLDGKSGLMIFWRPE